MSITDELREWKGNINTRLTPETVLALRSELNCIADRIDAEHERAMADAELAAAPTEAQLEELGYIAMPKDADGVPIRVGDKVEYLTGCRDVVRFLTLNGSGWTVNERGWEPFTMHHHHAPTVEDVLREFFSRYVTTKETKAEDDAILAEFAAKLRLAGDAE